MILSVIIGVFFWYLYFIRLYEGEKIEKGSYFYYTSPGTKVKHPWYEYVVCAITFIYPPAFFLAPFILLVSAYFSDKYYIDGITSL